MIKCGMPPHDLNLIHCGGAAMEELLARAGREGKGLRALQFTGSSDIAERIVGTLHGKVRIEDAGFDWKVLGPDVADLDYVAHVCDEDAYAHTGQKCSAQSIVFAHDAWVGAGLFEKLATLAGERSLDDLTIGPVLSVTTAEIQAHVDKCLAIPGARLLFGGRELSSHTIPKQYGAYLPTAVYIPLQEIPAHFDLVTTEIFGPFQVVTSFGDGDVDAVLAVLENMSQHL